MAARSEIITGTQEAVNNCRVSLCVSFFVFTQEKDTARAKVLYSPLILPNQHRTILLRNMDFTLVDGNTT